MSYPENQNRVDVDTAGIGHERKPITVSTENLVVFDDL